jgi:DNA-binding NarL/FixJ family response regulator
VILAEDSFILREGLRELLATRTAVEVVGVCRDLDALL